MLKGGGPKVVDLVSTTQPRSTLHMLIAVTAGVNVPLEWRALRREAGERGAIISLLLLNGDTSVVIVPAVSAVRAPGDVQPVPTAQPSSGRALAQLVDAVFAARAAIPSIKKTRVILFAGEASRNALMRFLQADPSIEVEVRSTAWTPQASGGRKGSTATLDIRRQAAADREHMEQVLPIGSKWLKRVSRRTFGVHFSNSGLTEWLADDPSECWSGRWALTPGDDTGGLETLRLEIQVGDYYSRLLWRGHSFVGKEFLNAEWQNSVGLLDKSKGYYYGDSRYQDVSLTRQ